MSDDSSSEKTEQPTPKKLRDSREQGQVAQSKEVTVFIAISTILVFIAFMHQDIVKLLANNYLAVLSIIGQGRRDQTLFDLIPNVWKILSSTLTALIMMISVAAMLSLAVNVLQIGGIVFSKEFFKFDLNKFNPVTNAKQIFSVKNLVKFLKNLLEIILITSIAYHLLTNMLADLVKLSDLPFASMVSLLSADLLKILIWMLGCYFILAVADWWWEKYNLIKQLKMTKDEVEKEMKDSDGDPEIKGKRKELHRELLSDDDGVSNKVKDSTMVLANPTHIAIVILFSPKRWPLPLILIKATDDHAQKIFSMAKKHNVLIIREKYLARQLYELAEVGKFVPASLIPDLGDVIKKNLNSLPNVVRELQSVQKSKSVNKV